MVLVPATVTDSKGIPVDGLESKDFVVLDSRKPQAISVDTMATGVAPIALIVAIQASGISRAVLEKVRKIGSMIQPLVTGDRGCAGVVAFSERIVWLQECTNDGEALANAFKKVQPGEPTAGRMLDAVSEAIARLKQSPNSRRVLLLISETRDRGSTVTLEQVAVDAQTAGVSVYSATYSAFRTAFTTRSSATGEQKMPQRPQKPSDETGTLTGAPPGCGPYGCAAPPMPPPDQRLDLLAGIRELARLGQVNTTQALAVGTGGETWPFARLKGLEEAIQKLGAELHAQYILSFTPSDSSSGYHKIEVQVNGGDYRVRARPGYWSGSAAPNLFN